MKYSSFKIVVPSKSNNSNKMGEDKYKFYYEYFDTKKIMVNPIQMGGGGR